MVEDDLPSPDGFVPAFAGQNMIRRFRRDGVRAVIRRIGAGATDLIYRRKQIAVLLLGHGFIQSAGTIQGDDVLRFQYRSNRLLSPSTAMARLSPALTTSP